MDGSKFFRILFCFNTNEENSHNSKVFISFKSFWKRLWYLTKWKADAHYLIAFCLASFLLCKHNHVYQRKDLWSINSKTKKSVHAYFVKWEIIYYTKLDFYLCILQFQVSNNINITIVLQYLKLHFNLINNNILTYSESFFSLLEIFKCIQQRSKVVIIKLKESWYAVEEMKSFLTANWFLTTKFIISFSLVLYYILEYYVSKLFAERSIINADVVFSFFKCH